MAVKDVSEASALDLPSFLRAFRRSSARLR